MGLTGGRTQAGEARKTRKKDGPAIVGGSVGRVLKPIASTSAGRPTSDDGSSGAGTPPDLSISVQYAFNDTVLARASASFAERAARSV